MNNALKVGYSVLRYRGGMGQWAWAVNRVAGLGVLLFLALHIFDIYLAGFGPQLFNALLFLYKGPLARLLHVFLAFGLLYHGLDGLRLTLMDFKPSAARQHIKLLYAQLAIFLLLFLPAGVFMLSEFYGNFGGIVITIAIIALPVVVAASATYFPYGTANARVNGGNYAAAIAKTPSSRGHPHGAFEFNMWLFMRISGILLIFLALFHLFWLHIVVSVEKIDFNIIVSRWTDPTQGAFWRAYDLLLLVFAFTHGMNGARMVLDDYVHSPGWRVLAKISLAVFWFLLMTLGLMIIFTFNLSTLPPT